MAKEHIEREAERNESVCRRCFHSYVCEQFNEHRDGNNQKCHFFNDHFVPTADVVEVVHGRWVDYMVRDWRCSVCGEKIAKVRNVDGYCYEDKPHYCPNCGAKMDLEGQE